MSQNPFPKTTTDTSTGQPMPNPLYEVWQAGWEAGYWDCMSGSVAEKAPKKT
jgi:protocatechuate 3,4-dioxygenase beta subunit